MIRTVFVFLIGVYIGQEYGNEIPSVRLHTYDMIDKFKSTELYKKIIEDIKGR